MRKEQDEGILDVLRSYGHHVQAEGDHAYCTLCGGRWRINGQVFALEFDYLPCPASKSEEKMR
mgnify:CR=1 FL=1